MSSWCHDKHSIRSIGRVRNDRGYKRHNVRILASLYLISSYVVQCDGYVIPPSEFLNRGNARVGLISSRYKGVISHSSRYYPVIRSSPYYQSAVRPQLPTLQAKKSNNNDDDDSSKNPFESLKFKIQSTLEKIPENPAVIKIVTTFSNILPMLKVTLVSFSLGIIVTLSTIFIPLLSAHDKLEQPVTLFETILADLDRGYVEEVNTKKLFETGVSAMLRSLDPYTEYYEVGGDVTETISGKYAGIGLVISGETRDALDKREKEVSNSVVDDGDDDDVTIRNLDDEPGVIVRKPNKGIRVVNAFEGYAYEYGMRVGDKLLTVDSKPINGKSVEEVRNMLRGEPGTDVTIRFLRDGVNGEQEVTIPRRVVKIRDVKCASLVNDDVGYVQLMGFSQDAGIETRQAIYALQDAVVEKTGGEMKGLILDLRNNPGGLLTSAVDISSLFVPTNSDIVSARGRGFPGILYRSRATPILSPNTKLIVLTNSNTASAAEIVSGAVQDSDAGVIIGAGRTFGKGLVQNVEELPFDTALKFTVAKYYTPSGRCIQSTNYKEGGGLKETDGKYIAEKVKVQQTFYTQNGREVKDGGGIEADFIVDAEKASALEVTLLRAGVFSDFAAEWSKNNVLTDQFSVSESTYKDFVNFAMQKQKNKDIQLEAIYTPSLDRLSKILTESGYKRTEKELKTIQTSIMKEIENDFYKYRKDIKEDISQNILARYLPDSMLIERGVKSDPQVQAAIKLIRSDGKYDKLLARDTEAAKAKLRRGDDLGTSTLNTARGGAPEKGDIKLKLNW
eukprot:CAMPEP_0172498168 /NCGR_PEP_ID=MMETSP1066-20121228/110221_1 /TAXON_ID=671091 /ORGANISM="Coscinodiscus wailesii, Strain CCMP2513" /LENGTH=787 /DNA_ID=CAMNT_0013271349 /DNA_START=208 /DNA_END=2571 /DNA_ORIENTATION=+